MKEKYSSILVKQARKMNHRMIQAKKEGKTWTAQMCKDFKVINMQHAGMAWIAGN